jgi:hypothetical protein
VSTSSHFGPPHPPSKVHDQHGKIIGPIAISHSLITQSCWLDKQLSCNHINVAKGSKTILRKMAKIGTTAFFCFCQQNQPAQSHLITLLINDCILSRHPMFSSYSALVFRAISLLDAPAPTLTLCAATNFFPQPSPLDEIQSGGVSTADHSPHTFILRCTSSNTGRNASFSP